MKSKKIIIYGLLLSVILAVSLLFLVSCAEGGIEGIDPATIINLLFPNVWVFLATIIATTLLFAAAVWLIWKPFNKKIDAQKLVIKKDMDDANDAKIQAIKQKQMIEEDYLKTQTEVQTIIANAKLKADAIQEEIKSKAHNEAHFILKNAKEEITIEKQQMQNVMHKEILDIAFDAVKDIAKQKITRAENDQLVEEFIANLDKVKPHDDRK